MNTYATYAAVVFGATMKLYDDMEDNPVLAQHSTPKLMELIKALMIASLTYASIHYMNFPIVLFIGLFLHDIMSDDTSLSTGFWHAFMIILLLLCIITFDISKLSMELIFSIIFFNVAAYLDHKLCPEEYSWKKIIWRTLGAIMYTILLQFPIFIPYYDILLFYSSYMMTSVLIMTYAKYNETKLSTESSKDPKEQPKEDKVVYDNKHNE